MSEAQRRLDAAAYDARMLAIEGEVLCRDNKQADAMKKYEEAAQRIGIVLVKEEKK
jgi:predicted negative regulator of RcsB-dependent stress response